MNNIEQLLKTNADLTEKWLESYMNVNGYGIEKSMAYSLLSGGKRIRPFLAIESFKLFSGDDLDKVMPYACAIEMIHTYSLIHDDLPAMDNDDYRRGKLTNHKVFGEAEAILAGDSLLTYAFNVLSLNDKVSDKSVRLALKCLSKCAGFQGMIGGQIIDINSGANVNSYEDLKTMHSLKTSNLIEAACLMGYYAACDAPDEKVVSAISDYAIYLGIAFQLRDDILDRISNAETLGKPTGSDEKNNKTTSLTYMDIDDVQKEIDKYTNAAIEAIKSVSSCDNSLISLAKYLISREK